MAVRSWTEDQKKAICARGSNLLVSAAAGSGKTAVLTQRMLGRITDPENPVEITQLLACTFSNDAAKEMRERLADALTDYLETHPDNGFVRRQLAIFPTAEIVTVHSFCQSLLREHFHLAGLSADFMLAEPAQAELLRKQAVTDAVEDAFSKDADGHFARLAEVIGTTRSDARLAELILSIDTFVMSTPSPHRWLEEKEAWYDGEIPFEQTPLADLLFDRVILLLRYAAIQMDQAIEDARPWPELALKYLPVLQTERTQIAGLLTVCATKKLDALYEALQTIGFATLRAPAKFDKSVTDPIAARRNAAKDTVKGLTKLVLCDNDALAAESARFAPVLHALFDAVRDFQSRYTLAKRERNLVDFNDLEQLTLGLLTTDTDAGRVPTLLAADLSGRYREILLDEYQDINKVQEAIFSAIAAVPGNLFMVGDAKQGIYRFRQADPTLLVEKKSRYLPYRENISAEEATKSGFGQKIILSKNFRSRPEITSFINRLFGQIMTKNTGGLDYGEEDSLYPGATYAPAPEQPVELLLCEPHTADKETGELETQAKAVADRIGEMLAQGYPVKEGDSTRPCRPGDFCVLLRSVSGRAPTYVQALTDAGIPCVSDAGDNFFAATEVQALLAVLYAIDNPLLDIELAAALLGPAFSFTPDTLARIRIKTPKGPLYPALAAYAKTDAPDAADCANAVAVLTKWRTLAGALSADAMISRVLAQTGLDELVRALSNPEGRQANLRQLVTLAVTMEQQKFMDLSCFLRRLTDWQDQGIDVHAAMAGGGTDAVRVMSIHKSKGLEYPICIVADLAKKCNLRDTTAPLLLHDTLGVAAKGWDDTALFRFETLPRAVLSLALRQESISEEVRILYVALTRAREKLILVGCRDEISQKAAQVADNRMESPIYTVQFLDSHPNFLDWILLALGDGMSALRRAIRQPACSGGTAFVVTLLPLSPAEDLFIPDEAGHESEHALLNPDQRAASQETSSISKQPVEPLEPVQPDSQVMEQVRRQLAYSYPFAADTLAPVKRSVSQLKQAMHPFEPPDEMPLPAFLEPSGMTPTQKGTATHRVLQLMDFASGRCDLSCELKRLVDGRFLPPEMVSGIDQKKLEIFLHSPVVDEILAANEVYKEQRLLFSMPVSQVFPDLASSAEEVVIQGVADCIYASGNRLTVLDYKTDRVKHADVLVDRYAAQLQLYGNAVSKLLGRPVTNLVIYAIHTGEFAQVSLHPHKQG